MKKYYFSILALSLGFTSCLKDDLTLSPKGSNNVLEIYQDVPSIIESGVTSPFPIISNAYKAVEGEEQFEEFTINYAGADYAPQDIQVTLGVNELAIQKYNDHIPLKRVIVGTDTSFVEDVDKFYDELPSNLYRIEPSTITIKKGEKKANFKVYFKTWEFDFSKKYALPISIKSASYGEISGNYGTLMYAVSPKNKYDGIYSRTTRFVAVPGRAVLTTPYTLSTNIQLRTSGEFTVDHYDISRGNYQLVFRTDANALSAWGEFAPSFTFDPTTNEIISVTNYWTSPSNGRGALLNEDEDNRYDPDTQKIYLAYFMTQPGNAPLPIYDTLTFVRDR